MRFGPKRRAYLAVCIFARSIIGGILIDAYFDLVIGWLFIIASIAVCLHPYFNHFLPKMIPHPYTEIRAINFLYDTESVPLLAIGFSYASIFLSVVVFIFAFYSE
jgi:hypothetical protein